MSLVPTAGTRPRWQLPRINPADRVVAGVAAAIAVEIGVQPIAIRVSFVLLTLAGGWGLLCYVLAWGVLVRAAPTASPPYRPEPKGASPFHRNLAVGMIVIGLLLVVRSTFGFIDQVVFPLGFIAIGALIAWHQRQDDAGALTVARIVAGVMVGVGGMIAFFALSTDWSDAIGVLVISLAVVSGIGLVAAPSLARIGQQLDSERQDRVRADERAQVAAHLHDSVLQTLALIQRNATDPTRTAQLARQQERELRQWLYRTSEAAPGTVRLGPALEQMAADVDAAHGVPVKVIAVGDNADLVGEGISSLVAATREAVVNGAKHSGAGRIDVFAERYPDRIEIFVRDTGRGFDPGTIDADRRGVSHSIIGRMQRAGGSATIHTAPGDGTEVELVLPLAAAPDAAGGDDGSAP